MAEFMLSTGLLLQLCVRGEALPHRHPVLPEAGAVARRGRSRPNHSCPPESPGPP